jgi:hypothetical protein
MRHMYVHRPRRLNWKQARPAPMEIHHPSGGRFLRTEFDLVLPRDPHRCEVDALVASGCVEDGILAERAETTVAGTLSAVSLACERVATRLRRIWNLRAATRISICQPASQWRAIDSPSSRVFRGFNPGSLSVNIDALQMNSALLPRLRCAAVLDADRPLWSANPFACSP